MMTGTTAEHPAPAKTRRNAAAWALLASTAMAALLAPGQSAWSQDAAGSRSGHAETAARSDSKKTVTSRRLEEAFVARHGATTIWQTIPPMAWAQLSPAGTQRSGEIALETITVQGEGGASINGDTPGYAPPRDVSISSFDAPPKEIPATVNILPREFVRDQGAERLRGIVDYLPAVSAREINGGTGDLFLIRGFESNNIAVNGLRRREFSDQSENLANIDRVEVLKGPAGLEVGIVEPGGIVNLVTKKPQFVAAHSLDVEGGSFGRYGATIDTTGPVAGSPNLAYRFISNAQKNDSFRDNSFSDKILVAPSLLLNYGQGSSALLELEYNYFDQPYDRGTFYLEGAGFPRNFAPIRRSLHEPTDSLKSHQGRAALSLDHRFNEVFSLRAAAEYLGESAASRGARNPNLNGLYRRGTNVYSGNPIVQRSYSSTDSTSEQWLTKLEGVAKFTTGPLEHQSIVGVGWSRTDLTITGQDGQTRWPIDAFSPVYGTLPVVLGRAENGVGRAFVFDRQSTFQSVYAQHKVDAWQRLHIIGGARLDRARFTDGYIDNVFTGPADPPGRYADTVTSYRIGAAYDLTDAVTVFAGYSNAFEPQPGRDRLGTRFEPLEADSLEAGVKVGLFGGRTLLTLSAFHITRANIAEPDPDNMPGESFQALLGTVEVRGVEGQLTGNVTEDLQLLIGASYLDAEITKSTSGQKGNRPYGVPEFQGSIWGKYNFTSLGFAGFSAGVGVVHVGERQGDNQNSFQLPAYTRLDAALFYDWRDLSFRMAAENLLDTEYYIGSQNRPQNITPGAPLRVTAGLTARF